MKIAVASSAFGQAFESGELTQLEFIEHCARTIVADGVVLNVKHFPRTDSEYLAQIKKMTTDLGLDIPAVYDTNFFGADETAMQATLDIALTVGSRLVAAPLQKETDIPWSEQLQKLGTATGLAKDVNVTLALKNAPQTFAASVYDCKRASKETDSAWLRFGLEPSAFDATDDVEPLVQRTVLLWEDASRPFGRHSAFGGFLGYLALDDAGGASRVDALAARVSDRARRF